MFYRSLGSTGIQVSAMGLGGHEFLPNGKSRGFNDEPKLAITPGHIVPGFGGPQRKRLVSLALDVGINLFDATIDSEKEALGRVLAELEPSQEVLVQTRPEGMVYNYDPANRMMADYALLRAEAIRILGLLRRETIDIFNLAFMQEALDTDPEYMAKIGDNVRRLKQEGLIRFASADTFSGQAVYLRQIASGHFDTLFIHYNPAERAVEEAVFPAAAERKMGILVREVFRKGQAFSMAEEGGIFDRDAVARACIRWALQHEAVSAAVLGVADEAQFANTVAAYAQPGLTDEDRAIIAAICATDQYQAEFARRRNGFLGVG